MKFFIMTLGCKVNQYESELMAEMLAERGFERASGFSDSDVSIINSCTVTATGDSKCRKYVSRARRENPDAVVVLCGCMPQAFPDACGLLTDCDIVMGNTSRKDIIDAVERFLVDKKRLVRIENHEKSEAFERMSVSAFEERARAFVKIEDGCNRFCSYCVIPYARGRVRSKPVDDLLSEAESLAGAGYKEIVLVGINLSAYGQELGLDIYDAVHAVCSVEGIERVRLGSIEPERMTRDILLALSREEKFCPHFHLSLQAGCDATLKRMRRHYDTAEYARIVADIRDIFDHPAITTDVMVGFVGESEDDFNASVDFCDSIGFAKTHVFPYSVRKGTAAEKMDGHIDEHTKRVRADIMIAHAEKKQREFMDSQVGLCTTVLIERASPDGGEGYTPNYTKVKVSGERLIGGEIYPVKITGAYGDHCVGIVDSTAEI